ncbi:hypothetical protein [Pseudaminobacter soli (ex Li et al. 2025)]|uniref:Uncharacterized protein n=1 Tax=Pseudaminobacter soli (ex Li et al. 2025) TaxID=1295366 RepID=A0A2P7S9U1_9HYPH|nr:hypothetical protein [Mesorhizobium soli]PSJ59244.1 hypothetical protein C7I85_16615 [Mesorhizobium soli]
MKHQPTLKFAFKASREGFGTIVIASLHQGRRGIWHEAIFSPESGDEVIKAFCKLAPEVFPESKPLSPSQFKWR